MRLGAHLLLHGLKLVHTVVGDAPVPQQLVQPLVHVVVQAGLHGHHVVQDLRPGEKSLASAPPHL